MVEKDIFVRRLVLLEEYYRDLNESREAVSWEKFKHDKIIRRYIERTLHLAIEACLDLANHIISYEGYREPVDNKDVFNVLHEKGVFSETLADRLRKMAQFRNIVVHDYAKIEPEIVYGILQNHLGDFHEFSLAVKTRFLD